MKTRRRSGQSVWEFRWRDRTSGKAVYRRIVLGTTQQLATEIEARGMVQGIVLDINSDDPYLYLISQFLNAATNLRQDEYGGNLENRSRFLFEVVESVLGEVDAQRVGVKISPMHEGAAFQANDETLPVAEYAIQKLSTYNLSHLLLMGNTTDFTGTPLDKLADDGMFRHFRPLYKGTLIANVKMDRDRGNRLIGEGLADLVAFGPPYIANPDLVQRFAENVPLADVDWETVYASGPHGYSDLPNLQIM